MISPISAGGGFTRTGICTIVDMSSLEIEVDVSESYINRVAKGQPVAATLDAYPNWRIPAKVIAIIPTADRQKATVKVRVGFEKLDPRILPDMSVKVAFQSAADSTTTAPSARTLESSAPSEPSFSLVPAFCSLSGRSGGRGFCRAFLAPCGAGIVEEPGILEGSAPAEPRGRRGSRPSKSANSLEAFSPLLIHPRNLHGEREDISADE
jgi:hypothetical protein